MLAYLDPGSGALIWQMLLSVVAGLFLLLWRAKEKAKLALAWIRNLFRKEGK